MIKAVCKVCRWWLVVLLVPLWSGCITAEAVDTSNQGVLRALWQVVDERYCFFAEKRDSIGLDWKAVYPRYMAHLHEGMTQEQLFEVCSAMLSELQDGHVNLSAAHAVSSYATWYEAYPANYSDSLQRIYLGRTSEHRVTSGIAYRLLPSNVGYMRVPTFAHGFGEGNLSQIMQHLASADGLIIDVRSNSGGMLTAAQRLAGCLVNAKTYVGTMRHKTGKAHDALSAPTPIYVEPTAGLRWQKPVVVLTNRRTYSAANSFVAFVKDLPHVTVVGDHSGGGGGMPITSELPNGWGVRLSSSPMTDAQGRSIEGGISPHVVVGISSEDYQQGKDTMIEVAIARLRHNK